MPLYVGFFYGKKAEKKPIAAPVFFLVAFVGESCTFVVATTVRTMFNKQGKRYEYSTRSPNGISRC